MNGNETYHAFQWLYSVLSGLNAAGGVHRGLAPANTPYPFIVFTLMSGQDVPGVAGTRLMTDLLVQVRADGTSDQDTTLLTLADSIDTALQLQRHVSTAYGVTILASVREATQAGEELADALILSYVGGMYRLHVQ